MPREEQAGAFYQSFPLTWEEHLSSGPSRLPKHGVVEMPARSSKASFFEAAF